MYVTLIQSFLFLFLCDLKFMFYFFNRLISYVLLFQLNRLWIWPIPSEMTERLQRWWTSLWAEAVNLKRTSGTCMPMYNLAHTMWPQVFFSFIYIILALTTKLKYGGGMLYGALHFQKIFTTVLCASKRKSSVDNHITGICSSFCAPLLTLISQ